MRLKIRTTLVLLVSITCSFASEYLVESIASSARTPLPKLIGDKKAVVMFFKPECAACRGQVGELSCLKESVSKIALGFGGQKNALWKESKKLKLKKVFGDNIFLSNAETLKVFGLKNQYSPQIFIFSKGKVVKHFLGLTSCSSLLKAM